ncbi:restriction endonuclease subunit S [Flavobacterium sp.]|uniref:restriction endonuclease subunit S n=1 Tax=Flavobacterium sp. TaxID=239 RepID=UPI0038D024CF
MKSNYKPLGKYIQPVIGRNNDLGDLPLMGLSIQKKFIPSIANTIGTDMSTYRTIYKNQFAFGPVTSRNGEKITIALFNDYDKALISQAYIPFEVKDNNELDTEYLMMWFRRPEFDRYARFKSHGSAREIFDWEEMCNTLLPVPHIDKQREIVTEYNTIQNRITINQQLIQKLEETAQAIFAEFTSQNLDESIGTTLLDYIDTANTGLDAIKRAPIVNEDTGIKCLRIQDVSRDANVNDWGFTKVENHNFIKFQLKKNDILIARTGATVGGNIFIRKDLNAVFNNGLIRVRANSKIVHPNILQIFFRTKEFVEHINSIAFGTSTQPNIQIGELLSFQVSFPSIEVQAGFKEYLIKVDNYKYELMEQINLLEKLKDSLLSKLATI